MTTEKGGCGREKGYMIGMEEGRGGKRATRGIEAGEENTEEV